MTTTVNAIALVARTRLTEWLGERTGDPAGDPLAAEHVAPVVAWLLGPGAKDVITAGKDDRGLRVRHRWAKSPASAREP